MGMAVEFKHQEKYKVGTKAVGSIGINLGEETSYFAFLLTFEQLVSHGQGASSVHAVPQVQRLGMQST